MDTPAYCCVRQKVTPSEASTVPSTPATSPRKFVFGEFFAGMGGFPTAVAEVVGEDQVEVMEPLDGYQDDWNILVDSDFERSQEQAKGISLSHAGLSL